jgi:hypothetical protein
VTHLLHINVTLWHRGGGGGLAKKIVCILTVALFKGKRQYLGFFPYQAKEEALTIFFARPPATSVGAME